MQIVVLVILLMLSAFFSSAETALTTVNKIRMRTLAEEGNKRAEKVLAVTDNSWKNDQRYPDRKQHRESFGVLHCYDACHQAVRERGSGNRNRYPYPVDSDFRRDFSQNTRLGLRR